MERFEITFFFFNIASIYEDQNSAAASSLCDDQELSAILGDSSQVESENEHEENPVRKTLILFHVLVVSLISTCLF
jgi:hypothetical protein